MIAVAPGTITVSSGRRTAGEQLELWNRYQAAPGTRRTGLMACLASRNTAPVWPLTCGSTAHLRLGHMRTPPVSGWCSRMGTSRGMWSWQDRNMKPASCLPSLSRSPVLPWQGRTPPDDSAGRVVACVVARFGRGEGVGDGAPPGVDDVGGGAFEVLSVHRIAAARRTLGITCSRGPVEATTALGTGFRRVPRATAARATTRPKSGGSGSGEAPRFLPIGPVQE